VMLLLVVVTRLCTAGLRAYII